jgi:hypothetical protein
MVAAALLAGAAPMGPGFTDAPERPPTPEEAERLRRLADERLALATSKRERRRLRNLRRGSADLRLTLALTALAPVFALAACVGCWGAP